MSTKSKSRAKRRSRMSPARRSAVFRLEKAISAAIALVRKETPIGVRPGDDPRVKRAFRKQRRVRKGRMHRAD